jgi:hypothetical protein
MIETDSRSGTMTMNGYRDRLQVIKDKLIATQGGTVLTDVPKLTGKTIIIPTAVIQVP